MPKPTNRFTTWLALCAACLLGACTALPVSCADSWKEEVLLHDGQKIMMERSQTYKGNSEIGQPTPVGEHTIRFKLPGSDKQLSWTSEYGEDLGRTNFKLVALHVLKDTAFLVAVPNLCLSYNKWGRPNPPYLVFKHDGNHWVRAALGDLPVEFKTVNVVINNQGEARILAGKGLVSAEVVQKLNAELEQPEYKTILREPMQTGLCPQYSSGLKPPNPLTSASVPK